MEYTKSEAKTWAREKLKGHMSTMACPFTPKNEVDEEALRKNLQYQLKIGTAKAIGCNWYWGEVLTLTKDERKQVAEIVVDEVKNKSKSKVLVGTHTTCPSIQDTIELTKHAEGIGADLAMMTPTFTIIRDDAQAYDFYKHVFDRVDIGMIIHNNSGYHGWNMSNKCIAKIAELENAIACKQSSPVGFVELYRLINDKVVVSTPLLDVYFYAPYFDIRLQAKIAHNEDWTIDTPEYRPYGEFLDVALKGDYLKAIEKYHKLRPYLETIEKWENYIRAKGPAPGYQGIQVGKYWGELHGMTFGHVRLPYRNLTTEEKQEIKKDFQKLYKTH